MHECSVADNSCLNADVDVLKTSTSKVEATPVSDDDVACRLCSQCGKKLPLAHENSSC